jgi:hypothetical protein
MGLLGILRPHRTLKFAAGLSTSRALAAHKDPLKAQERVLEKIVKLYRDTEVARGLGFNEVRSVKDLQTRVKVTQKRDYAPWIERLQDENPRGLVTKEKLRYLALTSGTSEDIRLFPFPNALIKTFRQFQWEIMLHVMDRLQNFAILDTNILVTAPAATYDTLKSGLVAGKATAIMTQLTPKVAQGLVRPPREILEMTNVDQKLDATVEDALQRDIRVVTGVPLCVLPLFERLVAKSGKPNLSAIWPNLAAYTYSGAALGGLEARLRELAGPKIPFVEIYSASESPIAYQFRLGEPGMLLDLRHCFFEFQKAGDDLDAPRLTVADVETNTPYRILITTIGGRFVYRLGDLIEFTSTKPQMVIRILGREQEELNLGYERVPLHVVRAALATACTEEPSSIHNFFVCPSPTANVKPAHEWHIEFSDAPKDPTHFCSALDRALITSHDRYAFARKNDHLLHAPTLVKMPAGTIERFVLSTREYGLGKFNAIYNTRDSASAVLQFASSANLSPG